MPETHTKRPSLTSDFDRALQLAVSHHRRQLRKGTSVPYTAHLLSVCGLVLEMGGSEAEAIAALLHDAVEDGGGPGMLKNIRQGFGEDAARIVAANTDTDEEPKPPWRERKEAYIAAIAGKQGDELRVSLADKLHNARSILADYRVEGEALWQRFNPKEGGPVRWYYRALLEAFEARSDALGQGAAPALAELRRVLDELDTLVAAG